MRARPAMGEEERAEISATGAPEQTATIRRPGESSQQQLSLLASLS